MFEVRQRQREVSADVSTENNRQLAKWLPMPLYPEYSISNSGRVRRDKAGQGTRAGYVLAPARPNKKGYLITRICVDGRKRTVVIHQAVAAAFIGSCPVGCEVNHIDGNKRNVFVENLEYVTHAQNMSHAAENGLMVSGEQASARTRQAHRKKRGKPMLERTELQTLDRERIVLAVVEGELERQLSRWKTQNHTMIYWLGILMEEVAEVAEAIMVQSPELSTHEDALAYDIYQLGLRAKAYIEGRESDGISRVNDATHEINLDAEIIQCAAVAVAMCESLRRTNVGTVAA